MRAAGVLLLYAAVVLRGAVVFHSNRSFPAVMSLLAAYGVLLALCMVIARHAPRVASIAGGRWWAAVYLLVQSAIVFRLLVVSTYEDFFALLAIPLCLAAVSLLGTRWGFAYIAALSVALIGAFQSSDEGRLFGLAMGVLYAGASFLFGGYAYQVAKAAAAHGANRRTFDELQAAHLRLQGYAEQATLLAAERERNRLARDLHDSVTQTVFSMNLAAQSTRMLLDRDPDRAAGQLLRLEELAAHALDEIGSLVAQLQPHSQVAEGLPAALQRLVVERLERDGLRTSLELNCERTPSEAEAAGLYAIVQEALANVAKHSGSRDATVRLDLTATASSLEIADCGAGFDVRTSTGLRGHLGLAGMVDRANEIGWSVSFESQPGHGTHVRAINPANGERQ